MSPTAALGIGVLLGDLVGVRRPRVAVRAGALAFLTALLPPAGLAAACAWLAWIAGAGRRRFRRERALAEADVVVLAELVALGLAGGLNLAAALELAGGEVAPSLAAEVEAVLRRARRHGLAAALAQSGGLASRLYLLAGGAVVGGAPVLDAVVSFVAEARSRERSRRLEEARKLPVRLLLPLALLILPGFVVLTVGPTLLAALERFRFPGS